jgi:hypothetical protein
MAYKQMAAVFVAAFAVSIPRFFEIELTEANKFGFKFTEFAANQTYTVVYRVVIFFLLMYLIPMVILTVLNSQLLCTLRKASISRASLRGTNSSLPGRTKPSSSQSHRSVTIIVYIVVLLCILCNIVTMTAHLLWSLENSFKHLAWLTKNTGDML